MHTLGYDFKPWEAEKSIADGPSILSYVNETADEHRIRDRIRFSQKLMAADWCSERGQWQLTVDTPEGIRRYRCSFLMMCAGYYSYDQGYDAAVFCLGNAVLLLGAVARTRRGGGLRDVGAMAVVDRCQSKKDHQRRTGPHFFHAVKRRDLL